MYFLDTGMTTQALVAGPAFRPAFRVAGGAAPRTAPLSPLGSSPKSRLRPQGCAEASPGWSFPSPCPHPLSVCSAGGHGLGLHCGAHVALLDTNLLLRAPASGGRGPFHFSVGGFEHIHHNHRNPPPASCRLMRSSNMGSEEMLFYVTDTRVLCELCSYLCGSRIRAACPCGLVWMHHAHGGTHADTHQSRAGALSQGLRHTQHESLPSSGPLTPPQ